MPSSQRDTFGVAARIIEGHADREGAAGQCVVGGRC